MEVRQWAVKCFSCAMNRYVVEVQSTAGGSAVDGDLN
jgi:hypothetical protein